MCEGILVDIIETLGRKWNLLVLNEIGINKKIRYSKLAAELSETSPATLSSTLKDLESKELIIRKSFNEIPPRVEYSLSKKGKEFLEMINPLIKWARNQKHSKSCTCNLDNSESKIAKIKNRHLEKLIEASMCACTCLPMMASANVFNFGIF